jgi:hypothetical protein
MNVATSRASVVPQLMLDLHTKTFCHIFCLSAANERYMEMAIGNAPWPIGVTNAGIHARPGRERIFR